MKIQSFHEPDSGTWTHLLADPVRQRAAIIDPVWVYDPVSGLADATFIDQVLEEASQAGLQVDWVLETHAHADHLTAADLIRKRTGAKIACSAGICGVQKNFVQVFNMMETATDGSQFDRLLRDGDVISLGDIDICVIATPGHTGDSITYLAENAAFIGDTLFAPSFGTARCDFPGGDAAQLYESIMKLYQLPGDTHLYLCHDYPKDDKVPLCRVSVEDSRQNNIHIRADTGREEFIAMRKGRDSQLSLPRLILPSLQVNILAGAAPESDDNGVPYLRTPFNRMITDLIKGET
jgi:glyoxylase-like metal-dependent hydrolase (beta-lactamase superfamily II)